MKINKILFVSLVFTIILSLSACNIPSGVVSGTPDIEGTVAAKVAIEHAAQTLVAQTLTAEAPVVPPTSTGTNTLEPPLESYTPSLTPTTTLTPTPEGVFLNVSQDTYCRKGAPYAVFPSVVIIKAGQQVEVIATNAEKDSFFVKNPYTANSSCWIYGKYATVSGNADGLKVATMQPTPTPTFTPTPNINFTVSYSNMEVCGGTYGFKLLIKNTGATTWQFFSISGSDTVTGFVINHTDNLFKDYSGCNITLSQADLTSGESSYIINVAPGEVNYNPAGHLIQLTVKLCSQDNALGTCISLPISFTP